jgi:hypothetical protein
VARGRVPGAAGGAAPGRGRLRCFQQARWAVPARPPAAVVVLQAVVAAFGVGTEPAGPRGQPFVGDAEPRGDLRRRGPLRARQFEQRRGAGTTVPGETAPPQQVARERRRAGPHPEPQDDRGGEPLLPLLADRRAPHRQSRGDRRGVPRPHDQLAGDPRHQGLGARRHAKKRPCSGDGSGVDGRAPGAHRLHAAERTDAELPRGNPGEGRSPTRAGGLLGPEHGRCGRSRGGSGRSSEVSVVDPVDRSGGRSDSAAVLPGGRERQRRLPRTRRSA